ncbi:MAG TPA: cation diffusion facilitator family transporter [Acidimicrobiia bacterium]|nr:cation diffusion facilitator family transporter [Acidimicrobiia bacterium]
MTSHAHRAIPRALDELRRLRASFSLVVGFMLVEIVGGIVTGSLALLSDAGHMGTDALGLGLAMAAAMANRMQRPAGHTFGLYRLEILAALANTLLLLGLAVYIIIESVGRLSAPTPIESGPMLAIALGGLVVNVISLRWLQGHSLNITAARAEVVADLTASAGVVVASLIVALTGWTQVDSVAALTVGILIVPRAWKIGRQATRVLVQAAPPDLDLRRLRGELEAIPGVVDLHDLHVWTLTSGMEVASAHILVRPEVDPHSTLDRARGLLEETYGIAHATFQVESTSHRNCLEIEW